MIPVSLRTFLFVGLSIVCVLLLLIWLWIEARESTRDLRARKKLRRCSLCYYEFLPLDPNPGAPSTCPRCEAFTV